MMRKTKILDPHTRATRARTAKQQSMRARNLKTGKWLHISGRFDVDSTHYAWIGSVRQFKHYLTLEEREKYVLVDSRKTEVTLTHEADAVTTGEGNDPI